MIDLRHHRGVAYTMDGTGWVESPAFPRQVFHSEREVERAIDGLFRHAEIGVRAEADRIMRAATTVGVEAVRRQAEHRGHGEWR